MSLQNLRKYLGLIVGIIVGFFLTPHLASAQLSTVGKEFWVGFMENNRVTANNPANDAPDVAIIIITAEDASIGTIQYANITVDFSLNGGQQFIHRITNIDIIHRTSGQIENKGVLISSSGNISVHAFNERIRSADGTVVLPTTAIGKDHYVTSHYEFMSLPLNYNPNINDESILLVLATEDNTRIEITPSVFTLNSNQPNIPFTITLNRGQTYQLKAKADLTGSRVRVVGDTAGDCKNIAVFGGNKWTSVGQCGSANDHLFQQIYPTNTWGTEYIHIPLGGRTSGELVKILASEDDTSISLNGTIIGTLNTGQFRTIEFSPTEVATIVTSKPSAVTVFAKSQECNDPTQPFFNNGDPFMISYSPNNQRLTSLTFNAPQLPSIDQHFVTIIVPTTSVDLTRFGNTNLNPNLFQVVTGTEFSYTRMQISQGVHRLENPDGFIAYVYGFGFIESYGYSAGARLEKLNFEVQPTYNFEVDGERVACLNEEALWEIFPENDLFTYFLWDFGDGSSLKEGQLINHTYTTEGTFEINVIAAISEDSCDEQQTITFEVKVESITGSIEGPQNVCPQIDEAIYHFVGPNFLKTEFRAEGGIISSVNEKEGTVTIQWGESNPQAKVYATPYTIQGCPSPEVELDIIINKVIDSPPPIGNKQVCFDESQVNTYAVEFPSANRLFTWFVDGGEIVGSNNGNTVEVRWLAEGGIGEIWYTEISEIDNLCAGESPKINVAINPRLDAEVKEINSVNCFNGANGFVEITASGGTLPYTYTWSHDSNLNQPRADGLIAGVYQVKVIDAVGCEVQIENLLIDEPDLLEIDILTTKATSCFGNNDGEATIIVTGGVGPYSIDYPETTIIDTELHLTSLEGNSYSFVISDANGCTIPAIFEIESPLPLDVDVRLIKPACPGESNGILEAKPMGSFNPFIFSWDFNNSNSSILSAIPRGSYTVSVRDQNNCVSIGVAEMVEAKPQVRMPTGFKLSDEEFKGVSNCQIQFQLQVINRWGQLVYSGSGGWDGLIDGEPAPLGSYSYVFSYEYELENTWLKEEIRGIFTLIH